MAVVRNSKTTGRLYQNAQTVEQADPTAPDVQAGNNTGISARSIYKQWNAAYRGFVPHGVRLPSPSKGTFEQFSDDPETFPEEVAEGPDEPEVDIVDIKDYDQAYWAVAAFNVTVTPMLIFGIDPSRTTLRILNQGPGIVWVGHNESQLTAGFPLVPMATTFYDLELKTTREVWAVQQSAQASPAILSVIREYTKEFHK